MEKRRLLKQRVSREKIKKKLLADPTNKYTAEELDLYLFGTDIDGDSELKAAERKKKFIEKQKNLAKEYLNDFKSSKKVLKEIKLARKGFKKNFNITMDNYALKPNFSKLFNMFKQFNIYYVNRSKSLNTFESWNKFRLSLMNVSRITKCLKEPISYHSYKNQVAFCKYKLYRHFKKVVKFLHKERDGKWGDNYASHFKFISPPAHVVNKLTRSLLKGNGTRLRRFIGNPDFVDEIGRDRSLALILFTAVCCYWFGEATNSVRFGTLALYDLFKFLHILESM